MVYRRKTTRKTLRKRGRKSQISRSLTNRVYSYKRMCSLTPWYYVGPTWVQSTEGNQVSNYSGQLAWQGIFKFRLSDLPNYTDFTNLYQKVKIAGVKLTFMPTQGTVSDGTTTTSTIMEPLAIAIDKGANDAVSVNPSFVSLLEDQSCRMRNSAKSFSIYISSPAIHGPADASTQVSYLANKWLDTSNEQAASVDFHGVKYCFQAARALANAVTFRVYATYYVKCMEPC